MNSIIPDSVPEGQLDKWKPFFSGFPKDTIFGAADSNSEGWNRRSGGGFFQVNHLFSNLEDMAYLLRLSFILRRIIKFTGSPRDRAIQDSELLNGLCSPYPSRQRLIVTLNEFYASLPEHMKLFLFVRNDAFASDMNHVPMLPSNPRRSSLVIVLNLLFFYSLGKLDIHTGCQIRIANMVYSDPAISQEPPSELCSSAIVGSLLAFDYLSPIGIKAISGISQIWQTLDDEVASRVRVGSQSFYQPPPLPAAMVKIEPPILAPPVFQQKQVAPMQANWTQGGSEQAWQDFQAEFEDEFLL